MSTAIPVAIVTGGSGGLGPSIAAALAKAGHAIVLVARRQKPLDAVAERLAADGGTPVAVVTADATDIASVRACIDHVLARFGRIDVLVNAAASATPIGDRIENVPVDALMGDLDTKVGGYLRFTQAVVPAMKRRGHGRIIHIGGLTGRSSDTLSGLRNAAVSHLSKVLSDELGPAGITVNAVHPGIVRTPHLEELFDEIATKDAVAAGTVEARFRDAIPMRRLLIPDEIGEAVAFLAGPSAASITGQSLSVDGGYSRGIYL